jgi:hypothetical protein
LFVDHSHPERRARSTPRHVLRRPRRRRGADRRGAGDGDRHVVDVRCYSGPSYGTLAAAVPSATSDPLDFTKFGGPVFGSGQDSDGFRISGGANDGLRYDLLSGTYRRRGGFEFRSSGSCGIGATTAINAPLSAGEGLSGFGNCAAARFTHGSGDNFGRSEIQVDGRNAYNRFGAHSLDSYDDGGTIHEPWNDANFPALAWTNHVDPLTGDLTVTEVERLVHCGSAPFPATAQCDPADPYRFTDTGVRFDRKVQTSRDGQRTTVTDTYSSIDGAAHSIDVEYDNEAGDHAVDFPAHAVGTISNESGRPGAPDESFPSTLTYLTQPDRVLFNRAEFSLALTFFLQYRRTVPADGSVPIVHVYNYALGTREALALAAETEDAAQSPSVMIDARRAVRPSRRPSSRSPGTASTIAALHPVASPA